MSPKYQLNKADLLKIGKGALIALGGALLTYIAATLPGVNFGVYTPLVVALGGVIINSLTKFLQDCK
jgi:hypothetical protein